MDYGYVWNVKTLTSTLVTLLFTFPGLVCALSKLFAALPTMSAGADFWFMQCVFNPYLVTTMRIERLWKVVLFEGMRWGILNRPRGYEALAVRLPVDLTNLVIFGGFLLLEKFWSRKPLTDKDVSDE